MKNRIAPAVAVAVTFFASIANATTYTFTLDDMSNEPNNARDNEALSRYWEYHGTDRTGTVWESPYTFTSTYPAQTSYRHFHVGFKGQGQIECLDINTQTDGHFVNGVCVPYDPLVGRGPFVTHDATQALYFQLIKDDQTAQPFVVQNIDVYNAATESITLYVRKTDGNWFYWTNLHGYMNGEPNYFRWTLTSGYTGKFSAMAWKAISGAGYQASVGRFQVTD